MPLPLLLSHLDLLKHGPPEHDENRLRLEAILAEIQKSPFKDRLDLSYERLASIENLTRIHGRDYVNSVLALGDFLEGQPVGTIAELDPETPLTRGSVHAARLAAGLGIELVERVMQGTVRNGFALVRPPGHHARPHAGMGYCVFNSIAIAAQQALHRGLKKIAIIDWDVHHGNGTQEAFYRDDRVLFIDLHQENLFPANTGDENEQGEGPGLGFTLNIPLPHSCGDDDYRKVFESRVKPKIREFQPQLILISAGFDAHEADPKGSMSVTSSGFGSLTLQAQQLAEEVCDGKLILFLEGGYDPLHLAQNVLKCLEALSA